jgi:hypothetical protein
MYGRVGSALPHDNPYYKARHPEEAERAERIQALQESASATALRQSHRAAPTPGAVGGTGTKAVETETRSSETQSSETQSSETKPTEPPRTTDP